MPKTHNLENMHFRLVGSFLAKHDDPCLVKIGTIFHLVEWSKEWVLCLGEIPRRHASSHLNCLDGFFGQDVGYESVDGKIKSAVSDVTFEEVVFFLESSYPHITFRWKNNGRI